ncbi:hypothetical protein [Alkaliphilus serpentinus]|uniref:Uncharacterized protein n=1 Tax=Alkaliphilus serpentinus TaxID=1482731 RepID=A0A833MB12_9FIRM|nr:hypothetical protein [Alkaliphilus serpentinus]KAB3532084.1 hypothetical protein F8153_03170 [Alkaliphilus serpentinus]
MENVNLPREVENILNSIPGVLSTKVIISGDAIEELHVMATTSRNAKQISRDIQSIMSAKFDMDFDHKKISIAQIDDMDKLMAERRIQIEEISHTINGNLIKVNVALKKNDIMVSGTDEAFNTTNNAHRVLASATLKAIHQLIGDACVFTPEDVEIITIGKKEVVVAAVSAINGYSEEMLIGTAIVRGELKAAIVKATLDAVNRKLLKLIM